MIPQHVINYWREQGNPESWIADKIELFSLSVKERNNRYIFIPGMPNAIPNDLKQAEVRIPYERDSEITNLYNDGATIEDLSNQFDLCRLRIRRILMSNGVDVPDGRIKPIGCPDCQTNEYSRGLCRNCYHRWRRNGSPTWIL